MRLSVHNQVWETRPVGRVQLQRTLRTMRVEGPSLSEKQLPYL
jgi:hypothetical protein